MSEEILEAFKKLKVELGKRDYDDERFIKDLPENEPVSLVIPFERTARGYLDIFRTYIGGDEHTDLSDEELLKQYLESPKGKDDPLWGQSIGAYTPNMFRGIIEQTEGFSNHKTNFSKEEVHKLINTLKSQGIDAVTQQDEKAQNPSSVVVMNNGIMTPFMDKKTVDSLMPKIKEVMSGCGFSVGGHISPITFEQLRSPFETEQDPKNTPFMHDFIANFSKKEGVELKDFTQLMTSNEKIKIDLDKFTSLSEESDNNGRPYLWRGGALGDKAFIANIDTENSQGHVLRKSWAMATPLAEYARGYAGLADRDASSDYTISFLYQYDTSGKEVYFKDRGIERQPSAAVLQSKEETPLFPHKHTLKNIFLYYHSKNDGRYLMRLDKDNPIHQQLLKLYEPKETRVAGHLLQRRVNQFNEASANNGHPKAYNPIISRTGKEHTSLLQTLSACAVKEKTEPVKNNEVSVTQNAIRVAKQSQH